MRRFDHAYVWERLTKRTFNEGPLAVLDYGTHDGKLLVTLDQSGLLRSGLGVDLNLASIHSLFGGRVGNVVLIGIQKGDPIPSNKGSIDVVTLVGVLEHVHEQGKLLGEIRRVLKDDGSLIIAVPGQHLFSFMDLGNLKFRFPRLHRWYYTRRRGPDDYHRRYVAGENGLIGDIEVEKSWHEHFKMADLRKLLFESGFEVRDADGFGFFYRALHNAYWLSPIFKSRLESLMRLDMRRFHRAELVVECVKITPVLSGTA